VPSNNTLWLAPLEAHSGFGRLEEFLANLPDDPLVQVVFNMPIANVSASHTGPASTVFASEQFLNAKKSLGMLPPIPLGSMSVIFREYRNSGNNRFRIDYSDPDGLEGKLVVQHPPSARIALPVVAALARVFGPQSRQSIRGLGVSSAESSTIAAVEQSALTLEGILSRQAAFLAELAVRNEAFLQQRRGALEDEFTQQRKGLLDKFENDRTSLTAAIEAREGKLAEKVAEFKAKVDSFETRDARWVRRQLLGKMESVLSQRESIKVSTDTEDKRTPIKYICMATMAFSALVAAGELAVLYHSTSTIGLYQAIPLASAAIVFGSTAIYFLRWSDRWFKRHADAEFRDMRFRDDILRASWLAELVFEWESEKGESFPAELLDRLSRDLFSYGESKLIDHPADALSKLMREAGSIKVGKGSLEVVRRGN